MNFVYQMVIRKNCVSFLGLQKNISILLQYPSHEKMFKQAFIYK